MKRIFGKKETFEMKLKNVLLALVLAPTLLIGSDYGCCSYAQPDCCDWCSDISVYGDWIYWKARRCDLDYAIPISSQDIAGDVFKVCPDYESGFRIGLEYECGCFDFGVRYTYFRTETSDSVSGSAGTLAPTRLFGLASSISPGNLIFGQGKWELDYDLVDVLVGYGWDNCSCFDTHFFGVFLKFGHKNT